LEIRHNVHTFVLMNEKEKRIVRGYKCAETPYRKAMRRSEKEKSNLATFLEKVVTAYAAGHTIEIKEKNEIVR
jgi:hypothetical protein